jgi:hypothetical protein
MGRPKKIENMLADLMEVVLNTKTDSIKFDKGNFQAGKRVRSSMQEIRKLAKEIRVEIQSIKRMRKAQKNHAEKN